MDLRESGLVDPQRHWYYQAKLEIVRRSIIKQRKDISSIVDIGAGSGFFSIALSRYLASPRVICVDPNYPSDSFDENRTVEFTRNLEPKHGELYLLMDVLEHVDDDLELLSQSISNASAGSIVLITVPAFKSMWSSHDIFLGHFRRYRIREVALLAERAGLEIISKQYIFSTIFPVAWLIRNFFKRKSQSSSLEEANGFLNALLKKLCIAESRLPPNRFFGLSVLLLARVVKEKS
jgi:hypothetical protein